MINVKSVLAFGRSNTEETKRGRMRQHNIAMATIKDIRRLLEESPARESSEVSKVQALRLLAPQILPTCSPRATGAAHILRGCSPRGAWSSRQPPWKSYPQSLQDGRSARGVAAREASEAHELRANAPCKPEPSPHMKA